MALIKRVLGVGRGGASRVASGYPDAHTNAVAHQRTLFGNGRKFKKLGLAATALVATSVPVLTIGGGVALADHPEITVKTKCTDTGWTATYTISADDDRGYTWNIEGGERTSGQKDNKSFSRTHTRSFDDTADSYSSGLTRWWNKRNGRWEVVASHGGATATASKPNGCKPPVQKPPVCHPVNGNGNTGGGWSISPDKASSHIDESQYPNGHYWKHTSNDGRHDVYAVNGECPGSQPADKVEYGDWVEGTFECGDTEVVSTRTVTTTKYVWDGDSWELDSSTTTTTTQHSSRVPTSDELKSCSPQPADKVEYGEWVEQPYECGATKVKKSRTVTTTKYVWDGDSWELDSSTTTTTTQHSSRVPTSDELKSCSPQPPADEKWECSGYYTRGYDWDGDSWEPGGWVRLRDITGDEALNIDGDCDLPPTQENWDCETGYSTGGYDWDGTQWVAGALIKQRDLTPEERKQLDCDAPAPKPDEYQWSGHTPVCGVDEYTETGVRTWYTVEGSPNNWTQVPHTEDVTRVVSDPQPDCPLPNAEVICTSTGPDYVAWQLSNTGNVDITSPLALGPGQSGVVESVKDQQGNVSIEVTFADGSTGTFNGSGEDCVFTPPVDTTVPPVDTTVPPVDTTVPPVDTTVPTPTTPSTPTQPSTPVASPTVEITAISPVCHKDAPYVSVTLGGDSVFNGRDATLTFKDVDGVILEIHNITFTVGETLEFLYPGAAVDSEGNGTDWPGWAYIGDQWVPDESDAELREGLTVVLEVNPTDTASVEYPAATSGCAVPTQVSSGTPEEETPQTPATPQAPQAQIEGTLPQTGSGTNVLAALAAVMVLAGAGTLLVSRSRKSEA